ESMTDEVSELVLRNNVGQSLAVSLDELRSKEALDDFAALVAALERDRRLDRAAEGIPDPDAMRERAGQRTGLTRPTLAVLLSHAKLYAKGALLESALPDDPATGPYLVGYFPAPAVEAAGPERLRAHQLRREIVTTELVNDLVNLMGSSFLHRMARDTGRSLPEAVRAWLVASRIAGGPEIRADLGELEARYTADRVYRWLLGLGRVLEATTQWLLANVPADGDTDALIGDARGGLASLRGSFARFVAGEDRKLFFDRLGELQDAGVDRTLAERLITLRFLPQLLEIVHVARAAGSDDVRTAKVYYAVSERFATASLREHLREGRHDPWERRYAQTLAGDVARAQRALVASVLARAAGNGEDVGHALKALEKDRARQVQGYRELLQEVRSESAPLAAFALAVRALEGVAGGDGA
ncbi:MAG TPA: hypothetical protein VFX98_01305, partial [Longimicrobiaceae bacterium]|nr:hypothetical protein [Longimicrobiaceae bacterium]